MDGDVDGNVDGDVDGDCGGGNRGGSGDRKGTDINQLKKATAMAIGLWR